MALKRYRLRIFDGRYEVLRNGNFVIDVDLDSSTRGAILDRQLVALTERAKVAENEPMDHPIMQVCDLTTGDPILDVVA
jgi:hypothetical protein